MRSLPEPSSWISKYRARMGVQLESVHSIFDLVPIRRYLHSPYRSAARAMNALGNVIDRVSWAKQALGVVPVPLVIAEYGMRARSRRVAVGGAPACQASPSVAYRAVAVPVRTVAERLRGWFTGCFPHRPSYSGAHVATDRDWPAA